MQKIRIAALLACYNRKEKTLDCLRGLAAQHVDGVTLDVYVCDDASSDGTPEAIADEFPEVRLLHGDGNLFWGGGMRRAFSAAMREDYDFYLWMNDDTRLDDGALAVLLATEREVRERGHAPAVVAGSVRDPETGELTYGGLIAPHRWRPLRYERIEPGSAPRQCHTMNGNTVLVPREVVRRIGNIEPAFPQGGGDYDYGLRARRAGATVWITPGTIATCPRNPRWRTDKGPLIDQYRRQWSVKGLPPRGWAIYTRRWAGKLWPLVWLSPYLRSVIKITLQRTPLRHRIGPAAGVR